MAGVSIIRTAELRPTFGDPRFALLVLGAIVLALFPYFGHIWGQTYLVSLVAKMLIFAIAAVSLDLILGYGGMVSFGHAAYIGLGAYAVAVFSKYGVDNGYLQLVAAIVGSSLVALFIGAISLRTSGVYFIMITLAFTQMLYYLGISLEPFGGDDGMNTRRSDFGIGALGIRLTLDDNVFLCEKRYDKACTADGRDGAAIYYASLFALVLAVWFTRRLVNSRFGMVIRGTMSNPVRMQAVGFPIYRYRLTAFVIAGAICGVAGFLFANHQQFLSPVYMNWLRSGEIMIMVILGGIGTIYGGVIGAIGLLTLEELLEGYVGKDYWQMVMGPLLVIFVLGARRGIYGLTPERWGSPQSIVVGSLFMVLTIGVSWYLTRIGVVSGASGQLAQIVSLFVVMAGIMLLSVLGGRSANVIPRFARVVMVVSLGFIAYITLLNYSSKIPMNLGTLKSLSPLYIIFATVVLLLVAKLIGDSAGERKTDAPAGKAAGHG